LRLVGDVASAVENVSAAYSDTTVAPHEYFDQTITFSGDGIPAIRAGVQGSVEETRGA
jgi:hypothetical protein